MEQRDYDIIIIGAGVIGHSIAFRLKRANPALTIAVLGDAVNSLMASRAAAGMLAPYAECEKDDRFFRFCRESLSKYSKFVEELVSVSNIDVYLSMSGSIIPHNSMVNQWEDRLRFFRDANVPHEVWSEKQVREKSPHLSENCGEVIWLGEGQVNNRQLHDALVAASGKLGVDVIGESATGFIRDSSTIEKVVTDRGQVKGKKFVLACGSWSPQMGKVLDVSMPLRPIKGQMCRLLVEDKRLEYTVHGWLTYIAPWREGNGFVLGSTMEDCGFNPVVEDEVIQGLIDRAAEILPCLREAPLVESWTGMRPAAEDLMPIMGKSVKYGNLYYSTGHYRNGILQTPNQADYLADIILETNKEEIIEFAPCRYGL